LVRQDGVSIHAKCRSTAFLGRANARSRLERQRPAVNGSAFVARWRMPGSGRDAGSVGPKDNTAGPQKLSLSQLRASRQCWTKNRSQKPLCCPWPCSVARLKSFCVCGECGRHSGTGFWFCARAYGPFWCFANRRKGAQAIRRRRQAPATDQTDDPAADAGIAAVARYRSGA
jgi:hypothetical protein